MFIKIGNQEWSKSNLNINHFNNGDPILEAKTDEEWDQAGKDKVPACCFYNNNSKYGEKYGRLYNQYAINDPRGLAPDGSHIPSIDEYLILIKYLGGVGGKYASDLSTSQKSGLNRYLKVGDKLKEEGFKNWYKCKKYKGGTNESGFSLLPGGYRNAQFWRMFNQRNGSSFQLMGNYEIKNEFVRKGYDWNTQTNIYLPTDKDSSDDKKIFLKGRGDKEYDGYVRCSALLATSSTGKGKDTWVSIYFTNEDGDIFINESSQPDHGSSIRVIKSS